MAQDIIPDSHQNRLKFFQNLKAGFNVYATAMKLDPTLVASSNAMLDKLIGLYQALVDAEEAVTEASANAAVQFALDNSTLRGLINNLKANPYCLPSMRAAMGIERKASAHDPSQIKPQIKAEAQPGHVRITGSKDYAELINIYMRLAGTTKWILVGIRRKKLPFDDQTPLAAAGVPEMREYQAIGVIGDDEVGQPSDIVPVTFAG